MNIGHFLTKAAYLYPTHPAWIEDNISIPYKTAEKRVNKLGNALLNLTTTNNDLVAMLLPNCHQAIETILAPISVGMAVVPLNTRLHHNEHQYMINHSNASILIYSDRFVDHIDKIRKSLPSVKHFVCVGETTKNDIAYEQLISSTPYKNLPEQVQSEDLAWLFYTSGTTGKPKGAMLSHRNLIAMANSYLSDVNPVKQKDVLLHAAPITHGSGLIIFHHIVRGASHTFPSNSSFIPKEIFKNIQDNKVTTMFLAPTMINMLMSSKEISTYDISSLHTVIYGGGPMYTEHILKAINIFGNIFTQIYGQGEAPMAITTLPKNEHITNNNPLLLKRLSSAGTEITGIHVKILDSNDNELPLGKHGEIVVRGDLVMNGYFNNVEATSQTLRNGWLHTGDIGYLDTNRYLYITDRKNDMIISGGANVYPREIEEVIATHPSVAEVAVIGIPDNTWGESVKAFVVPHEKKQLSENEIIEFCLTHLASYKKPKSVEILSLLPKNAYGKIEKQTLRQPYWKNLERNV